MVAFPIELEPGLRLLGSLSPAQQLEAWRACLLVYEATGHKKVPRDFQLQSALASLRGIDSVITAGTGSGKTLINAIAPLLYPETVTILMSPLRRIQENQVSIIPSSKLGVRAAAIHSDSPKDASFWADVRNGCYPLLIASPDQFSMIDGHLPRMAQIMEESDFKKRFSRVAIDEAHSIYTVGVSKHGEPAFRPRWGSHDILRTCWKRVAWQLQSATWPKHILKVAKEKTLIAQDCFEIRLSVNRPNITYATTPLIGGINNFSNLDCLIPLGWNPSMPPIKRTLVFIDSQTSVANLATYLDSRLAPGCQDTGIVCHYHNGMSAKYLQNTWDSVTSPEGACRIMCATCAAATGSDFPDVEVVIQVGAVNDGTDNGQRGGRGGRNPASASLYLVMAEPWVYDIKLGPRNDADPDEPSGPKPAKGNRSKEARIGRASVEYIQTTKCLRAFNRDYLSDDDPSALAFTNAWCCDRVHAGDIESSKPPFDLQSFFPSPLHTLLPKEKVSRKRANKYRPVPEREVLEKLIRGWRSHAHQSDPLRFVRPATYILSNDSIKKLVMAPHSSLPSPTSLAVLLEETDEWKGEWADSLYIAISDYGKSIELEKKSKGKGKGKLEAGSDSGSDMGPESEDSSDEEPIAKRVKVRDILVDTVNFAVQ
ncbi:hypothetical protein PLICRDRAFT_106554 [Plicaturopsis crispa FD-325 SS-3]|nr:hypothetical protein PLICRDRAFT_106554 [Plicaturopsis crispa FD-325 SS-3]